ncbi:MAG: hypothetical protein K8I60_02590, partial [Anaerolineae bacterium]|nr:hypothetical protein [Anaerolineae bacterium]
MIRRRLPDIFIAALLFALPLVMFWQQTVGGRTLLPTENLFQYEPFATYREAAGAPVVPHNALLSDLVLENYQWKSFIRQSISQGEIPLWNPHQFAGIPFLAAGQQSTLYPFSIIYYVLPLTAAYGWFTVVQLWLAGLFMYLFLRGLKIGRFGGLVAGVTYQLSAFFVISAVFPMIIGAAAWLPLILLMAEFIIQQRPLFGRPSSIPWAAVGAGALGCAILAGHVEITYYTLLITAFYAGLRLALTSRLPLPQGEGENALSRRPLMNFWRHIIQRGAWLVAMVTLGLGIGAIQFIPLFELVNVNFRSDSATYEQVVDWAHKPRDAAQFIMPNFYGSPAQHTYFDVFTGETVPVTVNAAGDAINNTGGFGIKNYVEGALYLGILPLALALFAVVVALVKGIRFRSPIAEKTPHNSDVGEGLRPSPTEKEKPRPNDIQSEAERRYNPPYRVIFALLTLLSLTFMFGLPTYRLLYILPGISQLHSPFRWIFAVTLGVAVLAGFGAETLARSDESGKKWAGRFGYALVGGGLVVLAALLLSRVFYPQIEPLIERIFTGLAQAPENFADARMFYSYQFTNVLTFGVMLVGAGVVFLWGKRTLAPVTPDVVAHSRAPLPTIPFWQIFAVGLIAADLMIASWGFNPASDPALLDYTPPAIEWLLQQPGDWRYTTLDD